MELITAIVPEDFVLYDMSDLHVGSPLCSIGAIQEVVAEIAANPKARVIVKGDAIECILPNDKRYVHTGIMDEYKTPKAQADVVIDLFMPIKKKILAWGIGNHCLRLINTIDLAKYMADSLGVPYGAYNFKIIYTSKKDKSYMFRTYHTHGWGGSQSNAKDDIQRDANLRASLKHKLAKSGHADCIYMSRGHDHQLTVVEPTIQNRLYLTDDGTQIHQHYRQHTDQSASFIPPDARWYATTGSFRKMYSPSGSFATDYAEMAGYSPSEIGFVKVIVKDKQIVDVQKTVV
ncbi:MAG: hypothetical protein ACRCX2_18830 [Paraclostridium sp.]